MRSLTLISVCLLLALPYAADATTAEVNSNSSVKVDLSNSSSRLKMVAHLGKRASEAKNSAWTRAQRKGWRVRGETDGIIFELMAIEDGQPIYNITNNINAAISTATDRIRNTAPYSVDGNGLTIGIWDAGSVLSTHQEFGTRVSVLDGADSDWHSTHVGGTIGAAGVDPAALGMAPGVDIDSYDWDSDTSEMTDRAASYPEETNKI